MKTVVVGGCGMIGRAVTRELIRRGEHVTILDVEKPWGGLEAISASKRLAFVQGDIRNPTDLLEAFRGAGEVYHFAGELGTSDMDDYVRKAVETNVIGTVNVLDAALATGVQRVFNPTKPLCWLNTYTITKRATEEFCKLYNKLHAGKIQVSCLRYFNAYGPGQHLYPIKKIVPAFMLQAIYRMPVEVYGSGQQTVDMIHVDDMAKMTVDFVRCGHTETVPDCGSGNEMTVLEVARDINALLKNQAGVKHAPMRRGEDSYTRLVADPSNLIKVLAESGKRFYCRPWLDGLEDTQVWLSNLPQEWLEEAMQFYGWKKGV